MTCINDDTEVYTYSLLPRSTIDKCRNQTLMVFSNTNVCLVWAISIQFRFQVLGQLSRRRIIIIQVQTIHFINFWLKITENAPKNSSILQNVLGGHAPRPPRGIGHVAPYLLLDGDLHNPSLNLDSLHVKNKFYYQSNESIKLISP